MVLVPGRRQFLKAAGGGSGQFEWDANARAHFTQPELFGGSVSYSDKVGPLDYTLSLKNGYGRGGLGGPVYLYDANHVLTEKRDEAYHSRYEQANTQLKLGYDGPGSSIGNFAPSTEPAAEPAAAGGVIVDGPLPLPYSLPD